jgi:RecB family exonuclease
MSSFSYSQLSAALTCQQLYKYLYVDKLKIEEPESYALHFGTAIHSAINALLEGTDGNAAFTAYWDSVANMAFQPGRYNHASLRDMGHIFIDRFAKLHLKHYEFIKGEERLYAETPGGIHIEGTADLLFRYKGKLTLVDFKTSSTRYQEGRAESSMQLALYAYLMQINLGIVIEQLAYVVFIKTKEPSIQMQLIDLDQGRLKEMILNIEKIAAPLVDLQNPTKNMNNCFSYGRRCTYWEKCHGPKA